MLTSRGRRTRISTRIFDAHHAGVQVSSVQDFRLWSEALTRIFLVQILFAGSHAAAEVALRLVVLQNILNFESQSRV